MLCFAAGEKRQPTVLWDIVHEEGREDILEWREKRLAIRGARKSYHEFLVYSFNVDTLKSFVQNFNSMVIMQMILASTAVYIFQTYNISFDVHVSLFVSPIVFPLAFSINTDFQRREKVLEDLAAFKSSGMVWYFCMREWRQAAQLDSDWITAVHSKLKTLLFHLREYLLTSKGEHRKTILRAMYEDFSDTNQLIEKIRASKLPANTAIVSRAVQLLNAMCLSFERLRVIREYRSPRSIRSFNKVFILFLPIILSPYFVFLGQKSKNIWEPYYVAVLVAFVFSTLQGAQDKLDDPFHGMSEDDIDLDTIEEWTLGSLEHTIKRTFDVGRFKVTVDPDSDPKEVLPREFTRNNRSSVRTTPLLRTGTNDNMPSKSKCSLKKSKSDTNEQIIPKDEPVDYKKFAPMLDGIKGDVRITRHTSVKRRSSSDISETSLDGNNEVLLGTIFEPTGANDINEVGGGANHIPEESESAILLSSDPITVTYNIHGRNKNADTPRTVHEHPKNSLFIFPEIEENSKMNVQPATECNDNITSSDILKQKYPISPNHNDYDNPLAVIHDHQDNMSPEEVLSSPLSGECPDNSAHIRPLTNRGEFCGNSEISYQKPPDIIGKIRNDIVGKIRNDKEITIPPEEDVATRRKFNIVQVDGFENMLGSDSGDYYVISTDNVSGLLQDVETSGPEEQRNDLYLEKTNF